MRHWLFRYARSLGHALSRLPHLSFWKAQLSRRVCDATHMASLSDPPLASGARGLVIRQPQLMGEHWRYTSLVAALI
jgi:hypothetical protein